MFLLRLKGRAARLEFALVFAVFVATGLLRLAGAALMTSPLLVWAGLASDLLMIWLLLAVGVRRLHDLGKSGWMLLLWIVPIVGVVLSVWFFFRRGESDANRFGPPPGRAPLTVAQDLAA